MVSAAQMQIATWVGARLPLKLSGSTQLVVRVRTSHTRGVMQSQHAVTRISVMVNSATVLAQVLYATRQMGIRRRDYVTWRKCIEWTQDNWHDTYNGAQ